LFDDFRTRIHLYNTWDFRLGHYTRFFGAAAATNALLAKVCTYHRYLVSPSTLDFLSEVGATLQEVNIRVAHSIASGSVSPAVLDDTIIHIEQSVLELKLRNLAVVNEHAHQRVVRQIDRLLNCYRLGIILSLNGCPNLRLYRAVLKRVAVELGRPASFSSQLDRVLIGRGLVNHLRQQELASLTAPQAHSQGRAIT
jgi:hypothetical protein